jgi:hypothetical protein
MIKQLDMDEIDVETKERFKERLEAWERKFYANNKRTGIDGTAGKTPPEGGGQKIRG